MILYSKAVPSWSLWPLFHLKQSIYVLHYCIRTYYFYSTTLVFLTRCCSNLCYLSLSFFPLRFLPENHRLIRKQSTTKIGVIPWSASPGCGSIGAKAPWKCQHSLHDIKRHASMLAICTVSVIWRSGRYRGHSKPIVTFLLMRQGLEKPRKLSELFWWPIKPCKALGQCNP